MTEFKIGDVVILKSGGPTMTVHKIGSYTGTGSDKELICVWFDGPKRMHDLFHPDTVEFFDVIV